MHNELEPKDLIPELPGPMDYMLGGETPIKYEERVKDGDHTPYLPNGERQTGSTALFDTLSCVTFSATNDIETQGHWFIRESGRVPLGALAFLEKYGYLKGNELNFSDRFTAIMSGTTKNGNYLTKVAESMRKDGLIPEDMLPMGGNSFEEYHDPKNITQELKNLAKEFLKYVRIRWQWVPYDGSGEFTDFEKKKTHELLKHTPLQIGIPVPATHAVMMFYCDEKKEKYGRFDHYKPFKRDESFNKPIHFAMQIVLDFVEDEPMPEKPTYLFTKELMYGIMKDEDVKYLQKILIHEGLLGVGFDTGNFLDRTKAAVIKFQEKHADRILKPIGLTKGTGNVKFWTLKYLNEEYSG